MHGGHQPNSQPMGGGGEQKVRTSRTYVINRFLYMNINLLSVSLGLCVLTSVAEHQPSVSSA